MRRHPCPGSRIRLVDRPKKYASPAPRISSTMRTSGLTVVAIARSDSRACMPCEYVLKVDRENRPSSVNCAIDCSAVVISPLRQGRGSQLPARIFSRPVNSGCKPPPISSSASTSPLTTTVPSVGGRFFVTSLSNVDFPAPLRPMMPMRAPGSRRKSMSRRAQNSR